MRASRLAGLVFLVAVVALVATALADLTFSATSSRTGYDYGGTYAGEERAVHAKSVVMRPGDRLVIRPNLAASPGTISSYDFHVVPGADRFALLDGDPPRADYLTITNMSPFSCCPQGIIHWDRPDDVLASRPGRQPIETGPGSDVEMRELETSALDQPERIDLVWVLHYAENVSVPPEGSERRTFESRLENGLHSRMASPAFEPGLGTVFDAFVLTTHPAAGYAIAGLSVAAAAAALGWTQRLRSARVEPEAPGAEGLLRLYDAAGAYLATLRDLLLGALVVVLAVALHVAIEGAPSFILALQREGDIGVSAWRLAGVGLMVLYSAIVVVWAYAIWIVHRALRRWRQRRAAPPFAEGDAGQP